DGPQAVGGHPAAGGAAAGRRVGRTGSRCRCRAGGRPHWCVAGFGRVRRGASDPGRPVPADGGAAGRDVITDGVVVIRRWQPDDIPALVAGRDDEFHRYMGEGVPDPDPFACITVGRDIVGWVDYDSPREWLEPGEVNLGYNVFPQHRGRGHATRAVQLLMHHFAVRTDVRVATLLIDPANEPSLALAGRAHFSRAGEVNGE